MKKQKEKPSKVKSNKAVRVIKNRFPITFEVRKAIEEVVKSMSPVPMSTRIGTLKKLKVVELTETKYVKPVVVGDKLIEPAKINNSFNIHSKVQFVNHEVEMHKAYRQYGSAGIESYMHFVAEYQKQLDEFNAQQQKIADMVNEAPAAEEIKTEE